MAKKKATRKITTRKKVVRKKLTSVKPSSVHAYCGELLYPELDDLIEVNRFIVRKPQISFDLVTTWGLGTLWRYSSVAALQTELA